MDTDTAYCRAQVETYDRDRYTLSLAAPESARTGLWAVYAFAHEIAKTKEVTRDAAAGHLRLAWWRERIGDFFAGTPMPAHDVARALGQTITTYSLPRGAFDALLDARARDLGKNVPASMDDLVAYADGTNAPLIALSAKILGVSAPDDLGTAWGLTGIIRALPWLAAQNRCILPLPMMHDIGLMPEQFHHLKPSLALSAAIKEIAEAAQHHLDRVHSDNRMFKVQAKMCGLYLKSIRKGGYDPFALRPVPFLALRAFF